MTWSPTYPCNRIRPLLRRQAGLGTKEDLAVAVVRASDDERKKKVKRVRDGPAGEKRHQKKVRADPDDKTVMVNVVCEEFALKLAQAQRKYEKMDLSKTITIQDEGGSESEGEDAKQKEANGRKEREAYHDNEMGITFSP